MRQKHQKPKSGKPKPGNPKPSNSKPSNSRRGGFGSRGAGRPFERQVDADLTGDKVGSGVGSGSVADDYDPISTEFSGADFPDVDSQTKSREPQRAPVITHAVVRERALRLLVNREHGRHELEQKLLQRELPQDLIDSVLDQLAEEGLQCDARFAESYTRMRIDRAYGANKVRADLQARRLEQSVIEDAITDSGADWCGIASSALVKKFGGNPVLDLKTHSKMQRYLYQRGFAVEEIRSAIDCYKATGPKT